MGPLSGSTEVIVVSSIFVPTIRLRIARASRPQIRAPRISRRISYQFSISRLASRTKLWPTSPCSGQHLQRRALCRLPGRTCKMVRRVDLSARLTLICAFPQRKLAGVGMTVRQPRPHSAAGFEAPISPTTLLRRVSCRGQQTCMSMRRVLSPASRCTSVAYTRQKWCISTRRSS